MIESRVGLVIAATIAWLAWLTLWLTEPGARLLLLLTAAVVLLATAFFLRSRIVENGHAVIERIRTSPTQLRNVLTRLLDDDGTRSVLGLLTLAVATIGVSGAIATSAVRRTPDAAIFLWGAVGVVGIVATWYLVAWRRHVEPTARVEATQSFSRLVFNVEDQEDPQRFNFRELKRARLTVTPDAGVEHWRLGVEFSENLLFSGWRYGFGHPLWHLTKNPDDKQLLVSSYDDNGHSQGNSLVAFPYDGEAIAVEMRPVDGHISIEVKSPPDRDAGYTHVFPLECRKFGRLFAWADGERYLLRVVVEVD